jgi:glycosyltransferase involved in cell wall biosynthesis
VKIAVTTGTFHPEAGGPPTYLHRLCAELVGRGHRVRLLTFGDSTPGRYAHAVTRVSRRRPLPLRLALYTAHAARLVAWADLVYASDYGLPAALVTRFVRRPFVVKVVGDFAWESAVRRRLVPPTLSIDDFQPAAKRGRVAVLDAVQRFYVRRADRVVVPSDYLAGLVAGWGAAPTRVRVVHNAVDLTPFDDGTSPDEAKARIGLPGRRIVLTIARLTPWKGVDHAIAAVAALRPRHDAHLVHCGDGPEQARLLDHAARLGVADRVHFRGRVDRALIPTYLRAADAFVLYSGYEGLPHVVLEAMAAGTPVVVSDRGGNVELVRDRQNGRVVPHDHPGQLTTALDELLADPAAARPLAASARALVRDRFSWPRLVEQTLAVFAEARQPGSRAALSGAEG